CPMLAPLLHHGQLSPHVRAIASKGRGRPYPPLEGEGRSRSDRGGVSREQDRVDGLRMNNHPTPSRIALRATRADPPPPGEGKNSRPGHRCNPSRHEVAPSTPSTR